MSKKPEIAEFCDHCGNECKHGELVVYNTLPFDVASANQGESGVVCHYCDEQLRNSP